MIRVSHIGVDLDDINSCIGATRKHEINQQMQQYSPEYLIENNQVDIINPTAALSFNLFEMYKR